MVIVWRAAGVVGAGSGTGTGTVVGGGRMARIGVAFNSILSSSSSIGMCSVGRQLTGGGGLAW